MKYSPLMAFKPGAFFFLIYFIDFVQRGRERDRELETSMRESHRSAASCTPPTGDMPSTKVHALDRNWTWDLSVCRPTLYPLSQTGFGFSNLFLIIARKCTTKISISKQNIARSAARISKHSCIRALVYRGTTISTTNGHKTLGREGMYRGDNIKICTQPRPVWLNG